MPVYLGIDPGASGGLACIAPSVVAFKTMPDTEKEIYDWIDGKAGLASIDHPVLGSVELPIYAVIEKVSGYIGQGQPGSAMFKFGMSYGALRMALVAAGLVEGESFHAVTPQAWQKALGIRGRDNKGGESKSEWKGRLKRKAEEIFPDLKITLATSDALILAEYCRRKHEGRL